MVHADGARGWMYRVASGPDGVCRLEILCVAIALRALYRRVNGIGSDPLAE